MFNKNKQRLQEKFAGQSLINGPIGQQFGIKPPAAFSFSWLPRTKDGADNTQPRLSFWFLLKKFLK
ncbi:MAG: hypothetical protein P4L10_10410 [Acidobacteriaceae bacterium]|jgi:hypothetical protein|nr:hypothetical protein [Acidobacteriaceae bacterium]